MYIPCTRVVASYTSKSYGSSNIVMGSAALTKLATCVPREWRSDEMRRVADFVARLWHLHLHDLYPVIGRRRIPLSCRRTEQWNWTNRHRVIQTVNGVKTTHYVSRYSLQASLALTAWRRIDVIWGTVKVPGERGFQNCRASMGTGDMSPANKLKPLFTWRFLWVHSGDR